MRLTIYMVWGMETVGEGEAGHGGIEAAGSLVVGLSEEVGFQVAFEGFHCR